jgi:hypothetical protein
MKKKPYRLCTLDAYHKEGNVKIDILRLFDRCNMTYFINHFGGFRSGEVKSRKFNVSTQG